MASSIEMQVAISAKARSRWWWAAPLGAAAVIYLVLALSLAYTKAPWCDEGWWVNPAYDLAFHGRMGMSVVDPSGQFMNVYLRGLQQRTYLFPPDHLVALAGWFHLFGFSAFTARLYSICWSSLALAAMFFLLLRLFADRRVALLATVLTSMEFIFLWSTVDGRPEAMANALEVCSVAAYVHFRQESMGKAILLSQILAAAGAFAHLNAVLIVLPLAALAWYLDRARLRWRLIIAAAVPYVIFAVLWLAYILQKPADFVAQFLPTAGWGERWKGFLRPDLAIGSELDRHLAAYSVNGIWTAVANGWAVIVPLLYFAAVVWFWGSRRRLEKTERAFLIFTLVLMGGMTFLNGFKGYFYLIYIVPTYVTVLAAWLVSLWDRSNAGKSIAAAIAVAFILVQMCTSVQHIRADEYHRDYEPTIGALEQYRKAGKSIVGTAALGFGLNFDGFTDDIREGMYSGLRPDVLVVDRSYRTFAGMFEKTEPKVFTHIVTMLSTEYRPVAQHGSFWIFERVPIPANVKVQPWIDVSKLDSVPRGERARYFFRMIFRRCKMHDPEDSSLD